MNWLSWFFKRLSEPSTHAGIAAAAQVAKALAPQYSDVLDVASAAFSAAAITVSEKGSVK